MTDTRERLCRILCEDMGNPPDEIDHASRLPMWALYGDTVDRMISDMGIPISG